MKKILMLTAAVFALQALPAFAQETATESKPHHEGKGPGRYFEKFDADKDGKISEAESMAAAKQKFTEMDGDKDGFVTKEEGKAHYDAKRAEWKAKREAKDAAAKDIGPKAE